MILFYRKITIAVNAIFDNENTFVNEDFFEKLNKTITNIRSTWDLWILMEKRTHRKAIK